MPAKLNSSLSRENDKRCTESQIVTIGKTHVNINACKSLGVTIDGHLSFGPQVKKSFAENCNGNQNN